ncbi:hypothetical protein BOX15_Mlig023923g1 [Macrostomum lignano]|uniref:Uncharacterized protein n=1 Tax=Macrostomum lignano TaxID=282301 RepID=A0A267FET3_9PLAT|nr:hypothetical protein BOX15_Mlig023923g1 [Macrostomum lignano]
MRADDLHLTALTCLLACWLLAHRVLSDDDLLPALQHPSVTHKAPTYYLPSSEDWRPSGTPQVSVLMAGQPLNFRTDPRGANASLQSVRLLFKCSSTDSKFNEALLDAGVSSSTHCRPLRPFTLERVSHAMYRLTLSQENQVPFKQALRHTLEFRLRLSFHQGELESASLFVFNFDALGKVSTETVPPGIEYLGFVTPRAFRYLTSRNYAMARWVHYPNMKARSRLDFLHKNVLEVIKQAEPMVRNLLTLTVYYSRSCGAVSQTLPVVVMTSAGAGGTISTNRIKNLINYFLDLDTGVLHGTHRYDRFSWDPVWNVEGGYDVCLNVSVVGELWPYYLTFHIGKTRSILEGLHSHRSKRSISTNHLRTLGLFANTCFLPTDDTSSWILLPAHLRGMSLSCPVFCNDDLRFKVGFEGSHCSNEGSFSEHAGRAGRPPCSRFFSVSPNSCNIDLVGLTSEMHAGKYTIIAGVIKYTYHVSVVSLPLFTAESVSTETLHFDPKSEPASLSCAVTYSGIEPVELVPRFRLLERFKPGQH